MDWRYRDTALAVTVIGNFSQSATRLALSPIIPAIIATFDTSKSEIGLALTLMWATYALLQFPSGVLGDRLGERRIMLVSLGLTVLGCSLLAVAPSFVLFNLFAIVLGAGTGLFFTVGASLLSRLFDAQGRALGYLTAGVAFAGVVVPVIVATISVEYTWRTSLFAVAGITFAALGVTFVGLRETPPISPERSLDTLVDGGAILSLLSNRNLLYSTAIAVVTTFTWQSFASFFPTFLIEYHGITTRNASVAFGAVFLLSGIVQPNVGRLSDWLDRDLVLALTTFTAAVGFAIVLAAPGLPVVVVAIGLIGAGISWGGVVQARLMDNIASDERGTGYGLVRTMYVFFGATGSVVTGTLVDATGWTIAYGFVAALLLLVFTTLVVNRAFRFKL